MSATSHLVAFGTIEHTEQAGEMAAEWTTAALLDISEQMRGVQR
jgi:hypothetical protein